MNTSKKISLIAAALASVMMGGTALAAESASTMTVSATLTAACEVSPTSAIAFGNIAALDSAADVKATSGSTFQVACSDGASPSIYATGTRAMLNGVNSLPFTLSLSDGGPALSALVGTPDTLVVTEDGGLHDVVLHAGVAAADFGGLPVGAYTADITVAVVY